MQPLSCDDRPGQLRRGIYLLLILVSGGMMIGRILAVDSVDMRSLESYRRQQIPRLLDEAKARFIQRGLTEEQIAYSLQIKREKLERWASLSRPMLSANDRSRWATLRALVEDEMCVPGVPYAIDKVIQEPGWDTIDMVKHDGHLYSSKPTLPPTLMAGLYWVIHRVTGADLGTHPYAIIRFMLIVVNVIPLLSAFWLVARLAERFGATDWGRVYVVAAAALGTFLTTFAVTTNNHLPAAVCVTIAVYAAVRIWFDGQRRLRYFVIAGLFSAFAVSWELPAMALFAALGAALLWRAPRQTLIAFAPAALLIAAGSFGTNWIAHGSLRPPYAHRSKTNPEDNWYTYTFERNGRTYESYWQDPVGLDRGEPSRAVYAFNALVGHHGLFSLTPMLVFSVAGLAMWLRRGPDPRLRQLALVIAVVSLACLAFYLGVVGQRDRNYGGVTSALRWAFWLVPLWLVAMLPAADATARRPWTRVLAAVLLALSALSAAYPTWNPWTNPWLMDLAGELGWM